MMEFAKTMFFTGIIWFIIFGSIDMIRDIRKKEK